MCLVVIAYKTHPRYEIIMAGNRDEFYERPTSSLDYWGDHSRVLAGRDEKAGGTWMGITREGRFAAITNFRDPSATLPEAPSRGALVRHFLEGDRTPREYLNQIRKGSHRYNGYR